MSKGRVAESEDLTSKQKSKINKKRGDLSGKRIKDISGSLQLADLVNALAPIQQSQLPQALPFNQEGVQGLLGQGTQQQLAFQQQSSPQDLMALLGLQQPPQFQFNGKRFGPSEIGA